MKKLLWAFSFAVLFSCSEKPLETHSESHIPELVITDSLVIDRLTKPYLIDVKDDNSEFLLHDFKTNEFIRVDSSGQVLFVANRAMDGKDSYNELFFYTADYLGDNQILLLTSSAAYYYDLEFNLLKKIGCDFFLYSQQAGGSKVAEVFSEKLFAFSYNQSERDEAFSETGTKMDYPFLSFYEANTLKRINTTTIPEETIMRKSPGVYAELGPVISLHKEEYYILYQYSPEIYVLDSHTLELKRTINLDPGEKYKQVAPTDINNYSETRFNELRGSNFRELAFVDDFLLTAYDIPVPDNKMESLIAGELDSDEEFQIYDLYKNKRRVYQIFKDDLKLWEGEWPVTLKYKKGLLYSVNAKPGEDPESIEKDVQTIYFYELK